MEQVSDLLSALEIYYTTDRPLRYNSLQRAAIIERFGTRDREYINQLYDRVIEIHKGQYGRLPDVAAFVEAAGKIPEKVVYYKALPELDEFDYSQVAKRPAYTQDHAIAAERRRVLGKKSNLSRYDKWWLMCRCVWEGWRPMPADWDMDWLDVASQCSEKLKELDAKLLANPVSIA